MKGAAGKERSPRFGSVAGRVCNAIILAKACRTLLEQSGELRSRFDGLVAAGIYVFFAPGAYWSEEGGFIQLPAQGSAADLGEFLTVEYGLHPSRTLICDESESGCLIGPAWLESSQESEGRGPREIPEEARQSWEARAAALAKVWAGETCAPAVGLSSVLDNVLLHPRVNVHERAVCLDGKHPSILHRLDDAKRQSQANVGVAKNLLQAHCAQLASDPYDRFSGAVAFEAIEWTRLAKEGEGSPNLIVAKLFPFFDAASPNYWDQERPRQRRLLYTASGLILRGEAYYANMRRVSPLRSMGDILRESSALSTRALDLIRIPSESVASLVGDQGEVDEGPWKLGLAFMDQLRNASLQMFLFVHALPRVLGESAPAITEKIEALVGDADHKVHGALCHAVQAYYDWLLRRCEFGWDSLRAWEDCTSSAIGHLEDLISDCRDFLDEKWKDRESYVLDELVRGWREADHPGENLLSCLLAHDSLREVGDLHAVGIGWGGIEIPSVFAYLRRLNGLGDTPIHVAKWSHYRSASSSVGWVTFPKSGGSIADVEGKVVALFDDNTLSGITLEKIRDELLLVGAKDVRMFVTRFSGERRLAHMKMEGHGAVCPRMLREDIKGYIGETAYSRSWSEKHKVYGNSLGIFSLGRRRILECLHNNRVVEEYKREGF